MKRYFFKITNTNNDKNKLYTAFRQFVESYDNSIMNTPAALKKFQKSLQQRLEELNKEYNRCQPIEIRASREESDGSFGIRVENSWYATFYIVKLEFLGI